MWYRVLFISFCTWWISLIVFCCLMMVPFSLSILCFLFQYFFVKNFFVWNLKLLSYNFSVKMWFGCRDLFQKHLWPQPFAVLALQVIDFKHDFQYCLFPTHMEIYSYVKLLPVLHLLYVLTNQNCEIGPVLKIQFKFRRLEIPMHFSTEHLGISKNLKVNSFVSYPHLPVWLLAQ